MAKKILLIEDRANTRAVLADILKEKGYKVVQASSGEEGLGKLDKEKPDLVLVDVNMPPNMDGYEVCQQIKKARKLPVKVVIYTATFEDIDALKARRFHSKRRRPRNFIQSNKKTHLIMKNNKKTKKQSLKEKLDLYKWAYEKMLQNSVLLVREVTKNNKKLTESQKKLKQSYKKLKELEISKTQFGVNP